MVLKANFLLSFKITLEITNKVLSSMEWNHHGVTSNASVPQGSVLGPLFFLVCINDLEQGMKSSVHFFANDTSLFSIVCDPMVSAVELNHDLVLN